MRWSDRKDPRPFSTHPPCRTPAPQEGGAGVRGLALGVLPACRGDGKRPIPLAVVGVAAVPRSRDTRPEARKRMRVPIATGVPVLVVAHLMAPDGVPGVVAAICIRHAPGVGRITRFPQEGHTPLAPQVCGLPRSALPAPFKRPHDGGCLGAAAWLMGLVLVRFVRPAWPATPRRLVRCEEPRHPRVGGSHRGPDTLRHGERGRGRGVQIPPQLVAAQALLRLQRHGDCQEPLVPVSLRSLDDRPAQDGVASVAGEAMPPPAPALLRLAPNLVTGVEWAGWCRRPAASFAMGKASVLCRALLKNFNSIQCFPHAGEEKVEQKWGAPASPSLALPLY